MPLNLSESRWSRSGARRVLLAAAGLLCALPLSAGSPAAHPFGGARWQFSSLTGLYVADPIAGEIGIQGLTPGSVPLVGVSLNNTVPPADTVVTLNGVKLMRWPSNPLTQWTVDPKGPQPVVTPGGSIVLEATDGSGDQRQMVLPCPADVPMTSSPAIGSDLSGNASVQVSLASTLVLNPTTIQPLAGFLPRALLAGYNRSTRALTGGASPSVLIGPGQLAFTVPITTPTTSGAYLMDVRWPGTWIQDGETGAFCGLVKRWTYTAAPAAAADIRFLPVAGSVAGGFGSFFRTAVQLHNAGATSIIGKMVFHPAGVSASANDRSLPFSIAPGQTTSLPDVIASMGTSGLGSLDVVAPDLSSLVMSARVYNDAGAAGTTGLNLEPMASAEALTAGDKGTLIAPAGLDFYRFNIGIRTLSSGAVLQLTLLDETGRTKKTVTTALPRDYFQQTSAEQLLATPLAPNDTVTINVTSGSAFVYGSMTDNRTQDPTYELARSEAAQQRLTGVGKLLYSVVGSTPGAFGSFFRTAMQLHNGGASTVAGTLVFHPAGVSASAADPSVPFSIGPGQTQFFSDVVAAIGGTGLGDLDVVAPDLTSLFTTIRIYDDAGAAGTTGMSADALAPAEALQAGDTATLIAPADPSSFRFNIGIRTVDAAASMKLSLLDASGVQRTSMTLDLPANYFQQTSAAALLGMVPGPNDTLSVSMVAGEAIVYGSMTDNRTQDPTYALARRR